MNLIQQQAATAVAEVIAGASLSAVLARQGRGAGEVTPHTRAATQDAAYGTLRWLGRLRALLAPLVKKSPADPRISALLWVAVYQLEYTRAAPHAVVNAAAAVAGEWTRGHALAFVNAVLRNFLRQRAALLETLTSDEARYSYPFWWIERVREEYPAHWEEILHLGNTHPPFTLRVNRRRVARDDYLQQITTGIAAEAIDDDGIVFARPMPVMQVPGFAGGQVSVQDAGAQWATRLLDVRDGMRVLDACAAPGGKTGHLLEHADIALTALDRDAARLARVADNLQRLGLSAHLVAADAADPREWWRGELFDRVLADVPCTASGIVRRHPDIKWLRRPDDIVGLAAEQSRLLDALWRVVARGGKLLYATCSIFARENDRQVSSFLSRHADARRLPLSVLPVTAHAPAGQLLPAAQHDGFFYALLEKH